MVSGFSCYSARFGILTETITHGENGLLVKPQNVEDLSLAIKSLLRDKQLREKLAFNGAQTVKGYDIRAVAPKMANVYHSVM